MLRLHLPFIKGAMVRALVEELRSQRATKPSLYTTNEIQSSQEKKKKNYYSTWNFRVRDNRAT